MFWVGLILMLIVLTALVSGGVLYILFLRSGDGGWRSRVLELQATGVRFQRDLHKQLAALEREEEDETRGYREAALLAMLKSVSVRELGNYPGIGPATIDRLQGAGFSNLAQLQRASIDIHGLGKRRISDISNGVRALTRQMSSRFEAGACQEARDLAEQIKSLQVRLAKRKAILRTRLEGAKSFLDRLAPFVAATGKIRFWNTIRSPHDSVIPPEFLEAEFPDLQACVKNAEESARRIPAVPATELRRQEIAGEPAMATAAQSIPVARVIDEPSLPAWKAVSLPANDSHGVAPSHLVAARAQTATLTPLPEPETDLLEGTIALFFTVARSDGRIARKERAIIEEYVASRCGQDVARFNRSKAWCAHYESAAIELGACLQHLARRNSLEERRGLLQTAIRIADATGPRNERESAMLLRIAQAFGLSVDEIERTAGRPIVDSSAKAPESQSAPETSEPASTRGSREEHLKSLEIKPGTPLSPDLVRRQYHLLAEQFAEERFAGAGAEFAAKARAAIRSAAEALLAEWNERLEIPVVEAPVQELRHNPDLDAMFGGN